MTESPAPEQTPEQQLAELDALIAAERQNQEAGTFSGPLAEALLNRSSLLADAGRPEDALRDAADALALFRKSDVPLYIASALNSYSNRLSDVGRDDDARQAGDEAFALAKKVGGEDLAQARFVMISCLMNQSGRSWRSGQSLRAVEEIGTAVELFRDTGEPVRPFLGVMLDALHRNAMALAEDKRWSEAVALRRMSVKLFEQQQVPAPIYHMLALTLQQAAYAAGGEGQVRESIPNAEEAAEIARGLAEALPEDYTLFLAQSLANLASRQHEVGFHEEALESAVESVRVFQEVANKDTASVVVPLSATLETFASILNSLGQSQQAEIVLAQRQQLLSMAQPVETETP